MTALWAFVARNPRGTMYVLGLALLVSWGVSWRASIRAEARREAEAEIALNTLAQSRAAFDSVRELRLADSVANAAALEELARERAASEARLRNTTARVRPAEIGVASAGASVDATMDTLRVRATPDIRPVVDVLGRQIGDERNAWQGLLAVRTEQVRTLEEIRAQQDSAASIRLVEWNGLWAEYNALLLTEEQARTALAASQGVRDGPWYGGLVGLGKGIALVGLGYGIHELTD